MAGAGLAFDKYLRSIARELHAGDSTEHTHRPALKELIESLAEGVTVTNEPKRRTDCGAPDMIVMRGQTPLGYIETKDVGLSLPKVERTAQLRRYLGGLGNLILTDYLEFRWYVAGQRRLIARLATMDAHDRLRRDPEGAKQVAELLAAFLSAEVPTVSGAKELAERMAGLARLIREAIARAFRAEDKGGVLHGQMKAFQRVLLHDLNPRQFADMYAQTICYGLFAARCNMQGPGPFTRQRAAYDIPKTNPFLRSTFGHIAGPDLDDRVAWAVDDLANLLDRANMAAVLEDFGKRTRREDPVVHFYETFLAAYDPSMREMRGVYYTPEPVVSYIVRSVDHILKKDFGLDDGLADTTKVPRYKVTQHGDQGERRVKIGECHKVLILDPACGTGTFLYSVIEHIHEHVLEKGQGGAWSAYVSSHLLPRLFGFELLMAPYAVAHMKLGIQLADKGYDFGSDERLGIYLTNSLE